MRPVRVLCAAVLAVLFLSPRGIAGATETRAPLGTSRTEAAKHSNHHRALVRHDGVQLHSRPDVTSPVLARLVQQTQVEVLRQHSGWIQVRIWASASGWLRRGDVVFRRPWNSTSTYVSPEIHYQIKASRARPISTRAIATVLAPLVKANGQQVGRALRPGTKVTVEAWKQDQKGRIWYKTDGDWAPGDALQFSNSDAAAHPVWKTVSGKGMWLTLGTVADSSPNLIVQSALRNGITHLYVEAAISPLGFHGKGVVGPLIDAAYRHHIAVIAWVYPYLYDLASDVDLTRQVARFRSGQGLPFEGIASDLERNVSLSTVRGYSQLVRYYLGTKYLLVGVTYPPQSLPDFPFAEVAHDYNVVAPMDYWHQTKSSFGLDYGHMRYGYGYAYRYAVDSIQAIRKVANRVSVAPIGQSFDNFGRLEMGPHAPSSAEIRGFLEGSKRAGAVGVSFFQWMTAGLNEWRTIHDYRF